MFAMIKQLGYRDGFFNTNSRFKAIIPKTAVDSIGVMPRAGYVNGYGWADQSLLLLDVSSNSVPTFTQMVQRNRSRL